MQIERLAVRLRLCTPMQAADLGVRLCQHSAASVYRSYLIVLVPVAALCAASVEISTSLPVLLLWWAKPWMDRTVLFALSRAAFGKRNTAARSVDGQREVWWGQWWRTWTLRRLTSSRPAPSPSSSSRDSAAQGCAGGCANFTAAAWAWRDC